MNQIENEHIIKLQYVDNRRYEFSKGKFIEEIMYYALGEYGEYFFAPGDWTNEFMLNLVAVSEEGVKFAKEWLGYKDDKRISFIYGNKQYDSPTNPDSFIQKIWSGGGAFIGEVFINMSDEYMPSIIIHEAVHAILRVYNRKTNFPAPPETAEWSFAQFLEEGLCNLLDYLFFLETPLVYGTNRYGTSKENMETYLHKKALEAFVYHKNFENEAEYGLIYPQLMSYETAASFIFNLLEIGTKQDFMRIFDDINLMEEVYGLNMDAKIAEWLAFLEQHKIGTR